MRNQILAAVAASLVALVPANAMTFVDVVVTPTGPYVDTRTGTVPAVVRQQAQGVAFMDAFMAPWWCLDPLTTAVFGSNISFQLMSASEFLATGGWSNVSLALDIVTIAALNEAGYMSAPAASAFIYTLMGGPVDLTHAPTVAVLDEGFNAFARHSSKVPRTLDGWSVLVAPTTAGWPVTQTLLGHWTVPSAPAIPEPATWAMMMAGFGLIGFNARRRLPAATVVA